MNKQEFLEELAKLGINLTNDQIDKLARFYQLLVTWNEKINLTTIIKEEEVYLKHFYDSLTLIKVIDLRQPLTVLDVGTGAGFPGIVLKIVFPNLKITLLDSLTKRINYLNEIIKELDLHDIETVCSRCEEYTKINREKYDLVVARAVSHLKILSEMIIPTVKVNGYFIAMKANLNDELEKTIPMLKKLNSELKEIKEFSLPIENSKRTLVVIKKNTKTALLYPRKYSEIKKMK
ncbi:MAG: 16S rRNA (guanine(527)-N(7))-methyltransferase RsmG [Bacilli bacterium]